MLCPKCGYNRQPTDTAREGECPACGIIYVKFRPRISSPKSDSGARDITAPPLGKNIALLSLVILYVGLALALLVPSIALFFHGLLSASVGIAALSLLPLAPSVMSLWIAYKRFQDYRNPSAASIARAQKAIKTSLRAIAAIVGIFVGGIVLANSNEAGVFCVTWLGIAAWAIYIKQSAVSSIGGGFLVACIALIIYLKANEPPNAWLRKDDPGMAYIVIQDHVKQRLKSPATAEFPNIYSNPQHVKYLGQQKYAINSYVDAQNSFGAMLRTNFSGEVHQISEKNWELNSLHMQE